MNETAADPIEQATDVSSENEDVASTAFSPLKRDRALMKLRSALAIAPDEKFLQLLWCVDALNTGRADRAARAITFPPEVAAKHGGKLVDNPIHPWELETLANQLLLTPKRLGKRFYPCDTFATAAEFTNYLRRLDDAEFGLIKDRIDIFNELHRIGQRQFPWQRNMANLADFYRPLWLFGQGDSGAYFAEANGLTVSDFAKVGFALFAHFKRQPVLTGLPNYAVLDLRPESVTAALKLVSIDRRRTAPVLRDLAAKSGSHRWPTAYQPSVLRRYPLVEYDGARHWAPLADLVLQRVTFGLYYDLAGAGTSFRNEISDRFERYCATYLAAQMPALDVEREYQYSVPGRSGGQHSPDMIVQTNGVLALVIECKATKLTLAAQYANDPAADAEGRYFEIGKGVFQLWRFFSHCRQGLTRHQATRETKAMVLTLDTWMVMSRSLHEHVLAVAARLADADPNILPEDRRPVLFAAVQDFERVVSQTTEERFLSTLGSATEDRFLGWLLPDVRRDVEGTANVQKPFPFDPGELLPWWDQFRNSANSDSSIPRVPITS